MCHTDLTLSRYIFLFDRKGYEAALGSREFVGIAHREGEIVVWEFDGHRLRRSPGQGVLRLTLATLIGRFASILLLFSRQNNGGDVLVGFEPFESGKTGEIATRVAFSLRGCQSKMAQG